VTIVVVLVALAVIVWLVVSPLGRGQVADSDASLRDELEALKEAKYREIRDAELDFRTGKLSDADWKATDRGLRAEAVDILRRIDDLG
jgi:hypothetical protein